MAPMIEDAIRIIDYTWVSKKKGYHHMIAGERINDPSESANILRGKSAVAARAPVSGSGARQANRAPSCSFTIQT
jgi:hypothetical protein